MKSGPEEENGELSATAAAAAAAAAADASSDTNGAAAFDKGDVLRSMELSSAASARAASSASSGAGHSKDKGTEGLAPKVRDGGRVGRGWSWCIAAARHRCCTSTNQTDRAANVRTPCSRVRPCMRQRHRPWSTSWSSSYSNTRSASRHWKSDGEAGAWRARTLCT